MFRKGVSPRRWQARFFGLAAKDGSDLHSIMPSEAEA